MFTIIRDATKLNEAITAVVKTYQSAHVGLHVVTVSAIRHAAEFGQPAPLNRIFNALSSNDSTALRNYIRRLHALIGLNSKTGKLDVMPKDVILAAQETGKVFSFSTEFKFSVLKGVQENRKKLIAMCDEKLINPDEKDGWTTFLARNNFAEQRTLGDAQLLEQITKIKKQLSGETKSDRLVVSVSDKAKKEFFNFFDKLESITGMDVADPTVAEPLLLTKSEVKKPRARTAKKVTPASVTPPAEAQLTQ